MSLRIVHIFFIVVSILLAFGTGYWAIDQVRTGEGNYTALAVGANLAGLGLLAYGVWFIRNKSKVLKEDS